MSVKDFKLHMSKCSSWSSSPKPTLTHLSKFTSHAYCILGESIIWFLVQFSDGFCDLSVRYCQELVFISNENECLTKSDCISYTSTVCWKMNVHQTIFFFFKARRLNRRLHIYTWNLLKTVVFEGSWLWLREEFAHTA